LHLDGLCDAADGLLAPMDRERRLAVMRAPEVGAFGVAAAVAVLLLRWASLVVLRPAPLLVVGLWAVSRAGMALTLVRVPYARPGGLAAAFRSGRRGWAVPLAVGTVLAAAAAWWRPVAGSAAVAAEVVAGGAVVGLAYRRLGGFTGDVLGAAGLLGETVGLVAASARW